jgi:hypothetical protein
LDSRDEPNLSVLESRRAVVGWAWLWRAAQPLAAGCREKEERREGEREKREAGRVVSTIVTDLWWWW